GFPRFQAQRPRFGLSPPIDSRPAAGEFKAPTNAAEFANLSGELLLGFDPFAVRRSNEQRNLSLSKRRRCVCSKQIAERFEFQHAGTGVGKRDRHRSSCYRENGDNNQRAAPRIPMKVWTAHALAARASESIVLCAAGNRSTKTAPPSGRLWQLIWPLWSCTTP